MEINRHHDVKRPVACIITSALAIQNKVTTDFVYCYSYDRYMVTSISQRHSCDYLSFIEATPYDIRTHTK